MDYTLQDYQADLSALGEVVDSPEFDPPGTRWTPTFPDEGKNALRELQHFQMRYGPAQGPDYLIRFNHLQTLLHQYFENLRRDDLVRPTHEPSLYVNQAFLEFLLAGFESPVPPVLFASHPLIEDGEWTSYPEIIAAFERWKATR